MDVKKVPIKDAKCNFCNRGTLKDNVVGLHYPYDYVYSFSREGNGLLANICEDCLTELKNQTNKLKND